MNFDIESIEKKIGYNFENKSLLKLAFTHSSYANENKAASNEKLEFLGDSILNFCVADYLFRKGGGDEGTLSVMRSKIVSEPPLARCVEGMDIIGHLICGVGESHNQNKSDAVRADLFEAVVGAVYLDCDDIAVCQSFILKHLGTAVNDALSGKQPFKYTFRIVEKKPKKAAPEQDGKDSNKIVKDLMGVTYKKKNEKKPKVKPEKPEKVKQEKKPKEKPAKKEKPVDYKSALQNYLQAEKKPKPEYSVTGQAGSAHEPVFNVEVRVEGRVLGSGAGGRKKDAEQAAAEEACKALNV